MLSATVIPVLMYYLVRGRIRPLAENPVARLFVAVYRPLIQATLRFPAAAVALALVGLVATAWPLSRLGSEFMPPLNEGDLLYMPTTPPGISITAARDLLQETDRIIATHPDVAHVLGKIGRADTATDPAPLSMIETTIRLRPQQEWAPGRTIEDIIDELDTTVQIPGLTNAWTMPIKTRIDMLATGIKTPVGIKLLGDDLAVLSDVGSAPRSRRCCTASRAPPRCTRSGWWAGTTSTSACGARTPPATASTCATCRTSSPRPSGV